MSELEDFRARVPRVPRHPRHQHRRWRGHRPSRRRRRGGGARQGVPERARRRRPGRADLPGRSGGAGLDAEHQKVFDEESAGYEMPSRQFMVGIGIVRADAARARHRRAAARLPPGVAASRRGVVPAVLRTGRRLRRRQPADARRARRRRVGRQRSEGVDVGRALCRLRAAASPAPTRDVPKHRGITMFICDMHAARRDLTAAAPDRRPRALQRGVPRRRPASRRRGRRAGRRRLAGDARHARQRAGRDRRGWQLAVAQQRRVRERPPARPRPGMHRRPRVRQALVDLYVLERILSLLGLRIREALVAGQRAGTRGLGGQARRHRPRQAGGQPRHGDRGAGPGVG